MRKQALALAVLFLSSLGWGQSFFQLPRPYPGAVVRVCPVNTANPCSSPVAIFQDSGLSVPLANPTNVGPDGNLGFWVASGQYLLQMSGTFNFQQLLFLGGGGGAGTTINPTNNVIPVRSNATTFIDSHITDSAGALSATEPFSTTGALTSGANGGTGGCINLNGATSGTASFCAPAVAGTTSNPIVVSNVLQFPDIAGSTAILRSTAQSGTGISFGSNGVEVDANITGTTRLQVTSNGGGGIFVNYPVCDFAVGTGCLTFTNTLISVTGAGNAKFKATNGLEANSILDNNGNVFLASSATASAVDSVTITNAATANPATVTIGATGTDSNINLALTGKGTGGLLFNQQLKRTCSIVVGSDNGPVLLNSDLGPQLKQCQIPMASTVFEVDVAADGGTPNVIVAKRHCTASPCVTGANETVSNLVSSALATAASGGTACSKTGATAGLDTFTTCSATLQNTSLAVGDWLELVSGTAGGTAKRMSIEIQYGLN